MAKGTGWHYVRSQHLRTEPTHASRFGSNYTFEKRQRDLAKRGKKAEKRLQKAGAKGYPAPDEPPRPNEN